MLPAVFVDARPRRMQVGILLVDQTLAPTLGLFSYADESPDFRQVSNVPIRHARFSVLFDLLRQATLLHLSIGALGLRRIPFKRTHKRRYKLSGIGNSRSTKIVPRTRARASSSKRLAFSAATRLVLCALITRTTPSEN
jgi:hypothetical protein